jgi:hypothetical protein
MTPHILKHCSAFGGMVAKFISFYGAWLATRGVAGNTHREDFHA